MRSTNLLPLALLFCNSYSSNEVYARPTFSSLPYDVLFLTFNGISITDFVSLASTNNSRIASIAADVFRHKYQDFKIDIANFGNIYRHRDNRWDAASVSIYRWPEKLIQIANFNLGLGILQHLGNVIKKVHIDGNYARDILEKLIEPLKSVEELSFNINFNHGNIPAISDLFPYLRRLSVTLTSNVDIGFVDCSLNQLEHLSIRIKDAWTQRSHIEGVIQKNAQTIKSIDFGGFPNTYIININQMLPRLQNLTIYQQKIDTGNDTIRFEHLKALVFYGYNFYGNPVPIPGAIDKLSCPRLESLKMPISNSHHEWLRTGIRFLENNHQYLDQLKYLELDRINLHNLPELTANLTNLCEISVVFREFNNFEPINELLRNHPHIMVAHFHSYSYMFKKPELKTLLEPFMSEWKIDALETSEWIDRFALERKI